LGGGSGARGKVGATLVLGGRDISVGWRFAGGGAPAAGGGVGGKGGEPAAGAGGGGAL